MTIATINTHSTLTMKNLDREVQKPLPLPKRKQLKTTASLTPSRSLLPLHLFHFSSPLNSRNPATLQRTTHTRTEIFSSRNTHIINKIKDNKDNHVIFSFEFFTPRYPESATPKDDQSKINDNFISMVSRMASYNPSYCDITWRPISADMTVELASRMQYEVPVDTMMHLTCLGMSMKEIDKAIDMCREKGVRNIMALRGDPPNGKTRDDLSESKKGNLVYGSDLVKHIRSKHGDFFGLAVAGYPEAHPDYIPEGSVAPAQGFKKDLNYLKEKVEAGADFIVTQFFFDTSVFFKFVDDCRRCGIDCPIVPGILPIVTYESFKKMTTKCRTKVPKKICDEIDEIMKKDPKQLETYGVDLAVKMCKDILQHEIKALHFYTMNKEEPILKILQELGLV
ncbi:hypothetical protein LUZ60_000520 [Juncus effusus]|nr:hypothetical protein LUZ60_000520 [Juncus effusus]